MARVTQSFITSLAALTVQDDGSLVDAAGVSRWCAIDRSDDWYLTVNEAYPMLQATLGTLVGGTAASNGAYLDASGESWVCFVRGGRVTAEPGTGPPPPR